MSRRTRLLIAAVLVLLPLGWLVAVTVRAPAVRLMGSSPADAQSLTTAPGEARLNLSAAADPALSHLSVVDSAGRRVDSGAVTAGPGDILRVPVRIDANGTYTVVYHVIGVAGGQTSGVIRFAVGTQASGAANVGAGHEHEHGVDGLSAVLLLVNLVTVVVLAILLVRRPAPRRVPPR
ncbi:copper resistance CopC family protein [Micromonospora lupini]|uniref:Copper resistance protein CopC n=1 Tax=Micromonospora lupini str. Lupac 08 TaxID=1150864 RepID=I0KZR7_9ACTN|nr:copper resistance CopC family protein [Micromonospora lupini]CCH17064.1 Copper resistance protein CopC [Micromonospora lupini str. Lupac 08]